MGFKHEWGWALGALLILMAGGCRPAMVSPSGMIDEQFYLQAQGQSMPVRVAGNLDSGKLLLIVHGGPGGSGMAYRDAHVIEWVEPSVAVVYWDQRMAGGTQGNGGARDLPAFRDDIRRLILLLKSRYGEDKQIYLMGHSWGGLLTPYFLGEPTYQALAAGWIQVGGAHNYRLSDSLCHQMLLHHGREEISGGRNVAEWEEIVEFCETQDYREYRTALRMVLHAHKAETLMLPEAEPPDQDSRHWPLTAMAANNVASVAWRVDRPAYENPVEAGLPGISLPVLLLWGQYDFVCPKGLMDDLKQRLGSPNIEEVVYPASGHSPMFNEAQVFWYDVTDWISRH